MTVVIILLEIAGLAICLDDEWYDLHDRLFNETFSSYNKHTRPSKDGSPVPIQIILTPLNLHELNEKSQTLRMSASVGLYWVDTRLSWDPQNHGGINKMSAPQSHVWLPPIFIANSVDERQQFGYDENIVAFSQQGGVVWEVNQIITVQCDIKISYYPFDAQNCDVLIMFTQMTTDDLNPIPNVMAQPILKYFDAGGTWEALTSFCQFGATSYKLPWLRYNMVFGRRSSFYVVNIILPVVFLSLTASVVFLLPAESGEKMGVSITVLLSYSVYLSIIADDLPQTSLHVCYLQVYLTLLLGLTALGVLLSVLVLRLHHISPEVKVGHKIEILIRWLRNLMFLEKRRIGPMPCYRKESPGALQVPSLNQNSDKVKTSVNQDFYNNLDIDGNNPETYDHTAAERQVVTWTHVAATIDRVFFVLFSLTILISTCVLLPYIVIKGNNYTVPTEWPTVLGCFNMSVTDR